MSFFSFSFSIFLKQKLKNCTKPLYDKNRTKPTVSRKFFVVVWERIGLWEPDLQSNYNYRTCHQKPLWNQIWKIEPDLKRTCEFAITEDLRSPNQSCRLIELHVEFTKPGLAMVHIGFTKPGNNWEQSCDKHLLGCERIKNREHDRSLRFDLIWDEEYRPDFTICNVEPNLISTNLPNNQQSVAQPSGVIKLLSRGSNSRRQYKLDQRRRRNLLIKLRSNTEWSSNATRGIYRSN